MNMKVGDLEEKDSVEPQEAKYHGNAEKVETIEAVNRKLVRRPVAAKRQENS